MGEGSAENGSEEAFGVSSVIRLLGLGFAGAADVWLANLGCTGACQGSGRLTDG